MEKFNIETAFTWIPSGGISPSDGWFLRKKIDADGIIGIVYDVEDDWRPRDVGHTVEISSTLGSRGIDWNSQPLGKVPDKVLAEQLGVCHGSVFKARKRRGIPGTRPPRKKLNIDWDAQPLGEEFDTEIARRLGVDEKTVRLARNKRGIPRKYVYWDEQPLGEVSDRELAEKLGVNTSSVANARRLRKIKAKQPHRKIDWSNEPLGKISDADLARGLGVSPVRVTKTRNRLGIPPFNRKNGDDKAIREEDDGREKKEGGE